MLKLFLTLFFSTAFSILYCESKGNSPSSSTWEDFKKFHGKKYHNSSHESFHKKIFSSNAKAVQKHNILFAEGKVSYEKELNKYSDADEQILAQLRGFVPSPVSKIENEENFSFFATSRQTPPTTLDWRSSGSVSPVKDQGQCGSCWAFSATGALESQQYIKSKSMKLFSEQQLVDCDKTYGDAACNGGNYVNAWRYIVANKGIQLSSSYPYTSGSTKAAGTCKFSNAQTLQTMTSQSTLPKNETIIMQYLAQIGPLSMALDATNLSGYSSGVYTCSGTPQINHAVLLVGYGVTNNVPYWIVKNSWGTNWGMSGYFYLKRGVNACGVATQVSYPII